MVSEAQWVAAVTSTKINLVGAQREPELAQEEHGVDAGGDPHGRRLAPIDLAEIAGSAARAQGRERGGLASPSTKRRSRNTRESAQSVTWAGTLRPRFWGLTSTWIKTSWRGIA